jgi:hypothetical protein
LSGARLEVGILRAQPVNGSTLEDQSSDSSDCQDGCGGELEPSRDHQCVSVENASP